MPAKGKFIYIRSFLNGLVLDIEGESSEPGAKVLMWPQKEPEDNPLNQLWYMDHHTSTIRSCLNDFCLDMQDDRLCVNPYRGGDRGQKWRVAGHFIENEENPGEVLDICGNNEDEGADVSCYRKHGDANQKWYIQHAPRRFFFLQSEMNGKVIDISGGDSSSGAEVITWERKDETCDNQLWYAGRDGIIKSKLNDYVLDKGDGDIKMQPFDPRNFKNQGFVFSNGVIRNIHDRDMCLDIKGANEDDGANICCWEENDQANQKWRWSLILFNYFSTKDVI